MFSDDCQIGDVPVRIGDIYEFQLAGFEIIAGQFAVFGGKIDVFFPLDDVTEQEVCVNVFFPTIVMPLSVSTHSSSSES